MKPFRSRNFSTIDYVIQKLSYMQCIQMNDVMEKKTAAFEHRYMFKKSTFCTTLVTTLYIDYVIQKLSYMQCTQINDVTEKKTAY